MELREVLRTLSDSDLISIEEHNEEIEVLFS